MPPKAKPYLPPLLTTTCWDLHWDVKLLNMLDLMREDPTKDDVVDLWRVICTSILSHDKNSPLSLLNTENFPYPEGEPPYSIVQVVLNECAAGKKKIHLQTPIFLVLCMGMNDPEKPAWEYAKGKLRAYCKTRIVKSERGGVSRVYAVTGIGMVAKLWEWDVDKGLLVSLYRIVTFPASLQRNEERRTFFLGNGYDLGSAKLFLIIVKGLVLDPGNFKGEEEEKKKRK
ncbi:hypothetical protein BO94DRAFT_548026 [Aspergillus sclerotioniger CBS 115572]|uniref:Uncharacterized protein n=1 Tax=Aspergillus sclerotioniger CBS 115572 TaxID=1450535 RepID=A0A317W5C4_9EURO|nr:hypothetical protein BO94DRAFT_548026 [Aspergillus sclerotioniger CBS 115572]PWY81764.1 hypothetical protein BO94DRAFT_548026 [Aspergillus sclerotioniger CBS 115572]